MSIIVSLVAGLVGTAYFIYGRKQGRSVAMWAGAGLCVYPYFISNWVIQVVLGLLLAALPFIVAE